MPTTEESRDVALKWIEVLQGREFSKLYTVFHQDAGYWVIGDIANGIPWGGEATISQRKAQLEQQFNSFKSVAIEIKTVVAEGARVVIEAVLSAEPLEGLPGYVQTPCFVFTMATRDGETKIAQLREYIDNQRALAFIAGMQEAMSKGVAVAAGGGATVGN